METYVYFNNFYFLNSVYFEVFKRRAVFLIRMIYNVFILWFNT